MFTKCVISICFRGFDPIMNCIDTKLAVFRTSDDTAEWYIGHMFNINTARHLKHNLTNSRPYSKCIFKKR